MNKKYRIILEEYDGEISVPKNSLSLNFDDFNFRDVDDDSDKGPVTFSNDMTYRAYEIDLKNCANMTMVNQKMKPLYNTDDEHPLDGLIYAKGNYFFIKGMKLLYDAAYRIPENDLTLNNITILYTTDGVPCLAVFDNDKFSVEMGPDDLRYGKLKAIYCPNEDGTLATINGNDGFATTLKTANGEYISYIYVGGDKLMTISPEYQIVEAPMVNSGREPEMEGEPEGKVGPFTITYYFEAGSNGNDNKGGYNVYYGNTYVGTALFMDGPGMNKTLEDVNAPANESKLISKYLISKKLYESESEDSNLYAILIKSDDEKYKFYSEAKLPEMVMLIMASLIH